MSNRNLLIAFSGLVFAFGALLLVTQEITIVLDGAWAAWVQAIGSVAAILVAIWIAHREHRRATDLFINQQAAQDREERRKARSLAIALFPELLEMKRKLDPRVVEFMLTGHVSVEVPPVLVESLGHLYLLKNAGDEIQQFLAMVRQLHRIIDEARGKPGRPAGIDEYLESTNVALNRAMKLLATIHDTRV